MPAEAHTSMRHLWKQHITFIERLPDVLRLTATTPQARMRSYHVANSHACTPTMCNRPGKNPSPSTWRLQMPSSFEHSWATLITSYLDDGKAHCALSLYRAIRKQVLEIPSAHIFPALLKACANLKDLETGLQIHVDAIRIGLIQNDLFFASSLVNMYTKCGALAKARQVLNTLHVRSIVLWTALIAGYSENGLGEEALRCLAVMQGEGVSPNAVTFVSSLKACGSLGALHKAQEIHAEVERQGLLDRNIFVGSALVDVYTKCGCLEKAHEVFDQLPLRNVVSWTALIAGYAEHGYGEEALKCFEQMQLEGISPNVCTLVCVLKACVSMGATDKGEELHGEIERTGLLKSDILCSTLVHLYANCGMLAKAQQVFDMLSTRDVVSWTVLLAGYAQHGHGEEALKCIERMQLDGVSPNSFTFVCSFKACGALKAADKGLKLHMEIENWGLTKDNVFIGSSLVDMYVKCGLLGEARQVFDKISTRNTVLWNALITGYVDHEHSEVALQCFEQMQLEGVSPDPVTFVCSLKACSSIGATNKGAEIHAEIARKGLLSSDLVVGNSLLDMYARSGMLAIAHQVFDELPIRNVVSWNSLITSYSQTGENDRIFSSLDKMLGDGVQPDLVSFLIVLNSCNRSGLVTKSHMYLETIRKKYDILLTLEHYICALDCLGRAGQLDRADAMISKIPSCSNIVLWRTMLCACRYWGQIELGKKAFDLSVASN